MDTTLEQYSGVRIALNFTVYVSVMLFSSVRSIRRLPTVRVSNFCASAKPRYDKPVGKNVTMAVVLLGFVGAIYYTAINKMRQVR